MATHFASDFDPRRLKCFRVKDRMHESVFEENKKSTDILIVHLCSEKIQKQLHEKTHSLLYEKMLIGLTQHNQQNTHGNDMSS